MSKLTSFIFKLTTTLFALLLVCAPSFALAENTELDLAPITTQEEGSPIEIPYTAGDAGTVEVTDSPALNQSFDEAENISPSDNSGILLIRTIFLNTYTFLKYIAVILAIAYLTYAGIHLVTAGKDVEEISSKEKLNIKWTLYGIVAILLVDTLVSTFFGTGEQAGTIFTNPEDSSLAYESSKVLVNELLGITYFFMQIATTLGVLVLILTCFQLLISFGSEDKISQAKRTALVIIGGLVLMRLAETIFSEFIFGVSDHTAISEIGYLIQPSAILSEILGITNYVLGFVSTLALVTIIYASAKIVMARGDDGQISEAKGLLTSAIIGLVIAVSSYAVVYTVIAH